MGGKSTWFLKWWKRKPWFFSMNLLCKLNCVSILVKFTALLKTCTYDQLKMYELWSKMWKLLWSFNFLQWNWAMKLICRFFTSCFTILLLDTNVLVLFLMVFVSYMLTTRHGKRLTWINFDRVISDHSYFGLRMGLDLSGIQFVLCMIG